MQVIILCTQVKGNIDFKKVICDQLHKHVVTLFHQRTRLSAGVPYLITLCQVYHIHDQLHLHMGPPSLWARRLHPHIASNALGYPFWTSAHYFSPLQRRSRGSETSHTLSIPTETTGSVYSKVFLFWRAKEHNTRLDTPHLGVSQKEVFILFFSVRQKLNNRMSLVGQFP